MKFAFIKEHQEEFPVVDMCRVLDVSKSGFYHWLQEPVGKRQRRREELGAEIARVHRVNRGVYGSPRVCAALRQEGRSVCRNTVAKVMKSLGIKARTHGASACAPPTPTTRTRSLPTCWTASSAPPGPTRCG